MAFSERLNVKSDTPEWEPYKVGTPSKNPNWVNSDCQRLTKIYHIAHIPVALEIVRSGRLMPRLVYDQSKLNKRRITVTWLSPNYWNDGSRYGNVQFVFDWKRLVEGDGKRFYWVEVMGYKVPACRILITKQDHSKETDLTEFDPTAGNGPWWWDKSNNAHWWNGNYCLEIMAEGILPIAKCDRVEFVDHHSHGCCINPKTCQYKGLAKDKAAALFLAGTISEETDLTSLKLVASGQTVLDEFAMVCRGFSVIWRSVRHASFSGNLTSRSAAALPIVRAILAAFARDNRAEAITLAALFVSPDELRDSLEALFKNTFGLPPGNLDAEVFG